MAPAHCEGFVKTQLLCTVTYTVQENIFGLATSCNGYIGLLPSISWRLCDTPSPTALLTWCFAAAAAAHSGGMRRHKAIRSQVRIVEALLFIAAPANGEAPAALSWYGSDKKD